MKCKVPANNLSLLFLLQKWYVYFWSTFLAHANLLFIDLRILKMPQLHKFVIDLHMHKNNNIFLVRNFETTTAV